MDRRRKGSIVVMTFINLSILAHRRSLLGREAVSNFLYETVLIRIVPGVHLLQERGHYVMRALSGRVGSGGGRRELNHEFFLCTRATAPPRVVKHPRTYAVQGSSYPAKAEKIAVNRTVNTRIPCELENAKIWQVEKLATQRISQLRHRGRTQPRGIRNRDVPQLPVLPNCSSFLHEFFKKSNELDTHSALL